MKILDVCLQGVGCTNSIKIPLATHVTILRGENGAGKTGVLEALALIGHTSVMRTFSVTARADFPTIRYRLLLERADLIWIKKNLPGDYATLNEGDLTRTDCGEQIECHIVLSLSSEKVVGCKLKTNERPVVVRPYNDMKIDLTDEARLRYWTFYVPNLSNYRQNLDLYDAVVRALQAICKYNRPHLKSDASGGYIQAQRVERIKANTKVIDSFEKQDSHPGLASYFSTDMYGYGCGLDICESPNHIDRHMAEVVDRRLGLFPKPTDNNAGSRILFNDDVATLFGMILGYNLTSAGSKSFKKPCLDIFKQKNSDNIDITHHREVVNQLTETKRPFLSSGENQALFIALTLVCNQPSHSIFFLDEADLHLDIMAATRLYQFLLHDAYARSNQYILVTHLPIMNSRHLAPYTDERETCSRFVVSREKPVGFVYIKRDGSKPELGLDGLRFLTNSLLSKKSDLERL